MQYFFLTSGINLLLMCYKNTELKASSSDSSYLCCSFCVQTLQKGFRCFFLLDVTRRSWLLLTMILLELSVYILSFTRFFVYWEVLATQPVPAVPESQGSVQQLWAAGTACSWASPFLGGASLAHPGHGGARLRLDLMIIVVSSKFNDSIFLLNVVSAFVNGKMPTYFY